VTAYGMNLTHLTGGASVGCRDVTGRCRTTKPKTRRAIADSRLCPWVPRCHVLMNSTTLQLSDVQLVPPPGELILNITSSCLILAHWPPRYEYMTSATKPEVHDLSQRRQNRSEPRPQATCTKNLRHSAVWFISFQVM